MMLLKILLEVIFLSIVFLHITRKNYDAAVAYGVQSLAVVLIIVNAYLHNHDILLILIALLTLIIKVILAPLFFTRLIKKHALNISVNTYLNISATLIMIVILTAIAHSGKLAPITGIMPENQALLAMSLAAMLLSLFVIVNRQGAFSQIIGILSFENSVVAFTLLSGLEQSTALQFGIIFDIIIWIIIATTFISMLYKHFGTLNVTTITNLKD